MKMLLKNRWHIQRNRLAMKEKYFQMYRTNIHTDIGKDYKKHYTIQYIHFLMIKLHRYNTM